MTKAVHGSLRGELQQTYPNNSLVTACTTLGTRPLRIFSMSSDYGYSKEEYYYDNRDELSDTAHDGKPIPPLIARHNLRHFCSLAIV